MSKYLLLYTVNKGDKESQASADGRRSAFDGICLDHKCKSVNGHQTAYTFFSDKTASELCDVFVKWMAENKTPFKSQDELYIVEISSSNEAHG